MITLCCNITGSIDQKKNNFITLLSYKGKKNKKQKQTGQINSEMILRQQITKMRFTKYQDYPKYLQHLSQITLFKWIKNNLQT